MATVSEFQDRFPEFASVADTRVQMFLDDASLLMGTDGKWLGYFDVAQVYYAAHLLTIGLYTEAGDSGPISPTKRQEVDDVVIENAISSIKPSMEDVYSTSYGKRFANYRRICFNGIIGV